MSKTDETLKVWAEHWKAQGVPALEAEAIAVSTLCRGIIYARFVRLEAVAAAARVCIVAGTAADGKLKGVDCLGWAVGHELESLRDALEALGEEIDDES